MPIWYWSRERSPEDIQRKILSRQEPAAAAQIELTAEEVRRLEKLGSETGVHTLREWEKEMA